MQRRKGFFEDSMLCGMAFDASSDVSNRLCALDETNSLCDWHSYIMKELRAKTGELQKVQLAIDVRALL